MDATVTLQDKLLDSLTSEPRGASFSGPDKPNFSYTVISQEKSRALGEDEFKDSLLKLKPWTVPFSFAGNLLNSPRLRSN